MKNKFPIVLGISFLVYIFGFFGLQLIAKDRDFSELENRTLSKRPTFSVDSLLDGTFGTNFETYIADQFPLRDPFISLKSNSERTLQKKENNGVFIGKDGYFLQKFDTPDMAIAQRNAGYVDLLAQDLNVYMALAPTATKVLADKLPKYAITYDEGTYINDFYGLLSDTIYKVPILSVLQAHADESLYYQTDHHWTTLGAYYAYTAFCESAGFTPIPLSDFQIETVSENFYGTLFSKGNFTFATPDTIQIFHPTNQQPLTLYYEASGEVTNTLYHYEHLDTKDQYSMFLNGNHPLIRIETGVKNGRKLLVVKDSYANSLVPFLTAHYEEIQIVDLRLMNMPLKTYAATHSIEDVLILYNVQNFSVESKFSLLTK